MALSRDVMSGSCIKIGILHIETSILELPKPGFTSMLEIVYIIEFFFIIK